MILIYMILYLFSALQFYQGAHSEELGRYGEMVRVFATCTYGKYIYIHVYIASPPPLSFLHPLPLSPSPPLSFLHPLPLSSTLLPSPSPPLLHSPSFTLSPSPPPLSFLHPLPLSSTLLPSPSPPLLLHSPSFTLSDISDAAHSPETGLNIGEASQGNRGHSEDGQTELCRSRDG